jgi:plasmid stabilization system protein ParE
VFQVCLGPRATRQVARARAWWCEHRDKAPAAFDDDLAAVIAKLEESPHLVGRASQRRPGVRRVTMRRIGYALYFRIDEPAHRVIVITLWHGSRGTDPRM